MPCSMTASKLLASGAPAVAHLLLTEGRLILSLLKSLSSRCVVNTAQNVHAPKLFASLRSRTSTPEGLFRSPSVSILFRCQLALAGLALQCSAACRQH